MKLLTTITDRDILTDYQKQSEIKYIFRKAVRAIVFDDNKKIVLLNVAKKNYHKLPGGGVKNKENDLEALKRECLEEIGCNVEVKQELGIIKEFRDGFKQEQDSYCFLAKVFGPKGEPQFTAKELSQGFEPVWVANEEPGGTDPEWMVIDKAIEILKTDQPKDYEGKFIQKRDLIFLQEAKKYLI
ncbi:MAG: ADP-ribose pyrophosphatase [Candidatus Berkelbacteria bacterium]|nr:ADP-ribose pyrophosphatase [Candidatus Berkelbacteria bacterium]